MSALPYRDIQNWGRPSRCLFYPKTPTQVLLTYLPMHLRANKDFLFTFSLTLKKCKEAIWSFNLTLENKRDWKQKKKREVAIPCHVQNVDKTVKKQEHISNIMSPVLKQLKQVMAELKALQMSMNWIGVTKVFCLIANKLLNVFVFQFSTCYTRISLARGFWGDTSLWLWIACLRAV